MPAATRTAPGARWADRRRAAVRPALVSRASPRVRASCGPRANSARPHLGLARDRRLNVRKSGKPDLRGPSAREGCREDAALRALGSDRARCRIIPIHNFKQRSLLHSRGAFLRPGFAFLLSITPMRGERSAEKAQYSVVARFGARRAVPSEARRASGGTRSPLGAPPWRFWVGGRASISGISSGFVQRAPRSQVVVPGGRGPEPPGADGYEPRPQDATPRSAFGSSPETAPQMSEDGRTLSQVRKVVNSIDRRKCSQSRRRDRGSQSGQGALIESADRQWPLIDCRR
jgi:hypothetical protein